MQAFKKFGIIPWGFIKVVCIANSFLFIAK